MSILRMLLWKLQELQRGAMPINFISASIDITVDGQQVRTVMGATVAAALIAADRPVLRRSPRAGTPRGVHCGMGHCFECLVTIDGTPGRRACLVEVRDGMSVETGR